MGVQVPPGHQPFIHAAMTPVPRLTPLRRAEYAAGTGARPRGASDTQNIHLWPCLQRILAPCGDSTHISPDRFEHQGVEVGAASCAARDEYGERTR